MRPLAGLFGGSPCVVVEVDQTSDNRDYVWIVSKGHDGVSRLVTVNADSVEILPHGEVLDLLTRREETR